MSPGTTITVPATRRAAMGRRVWQGLFHGIYRTETVDGWRVPTSGPVLLASNHTGLIDGPLVFGLAPRPAHFVVKQEMFHGVAGLVLNAMGQIPIDRSSADRVAITTALAVLERGGVVGVFPEGSRGNGDVASMHAGVTFLALASGAPIVPVACLGTRPDGAGTGRPPMPGRRLAVVFGEPVTLVPPPGLPRRTANRVVTEQVRTILADHVRASSARTGIPLYESTTPRHPGLEDPS